MSTINYNNNNAKKGVTPLSGGVGATSGPKKLVIKNYKEVLKTPANYESDSWSSLSHAIYCIYTKQPVQLTLEELYRMVDNLCQSSKGAATLYTNLTQEMEIHINDKLGSLVGQSSDVTTFIALVNACWESLSHDLILIMSIFLCLDRTYVMQNQSILSIWDKGLLSFRENLQSLPGVESQLLNNLLQSIKNERNGEATNRDLLHSSIKMLKSLHMYDAFQKSLIAETTAYYENEGNVLSVDYEVPAYLRHVQTRLTEESDRSLRYLDPMTKRAIFQVVDRQLIEQHITMLIGKGFKTMMSLSRIDDIERLFALANRVNAIPVIKTAWAAYIKEVGLAMILDTEKDAVLVKELITLKDNLDVILEKAFNRNEILGYSLKESFEHFINRRQNKPAELIAKFIDSKLRSGNKGQTEDELEMMMNKALMLFRYIQGKDVFEAFYKVDLSRRLLLEKNTSIDAEKSMITKLRNECGTQFTKNLEGMFNDIELSNDINLQFKASPLLSHIKNVDLNVFVLASGSWPPTPQVEAVLPKEFIEYQELYNKFYLQKNANKKLLWINSLGRCVLKATFPLPLTRSKTRILLRKSKNKSKELENDDLFSFNTEFTQKLIRIKVNALQAEETAEENLKTNETIVGDRQYQIDAAIVLNAACQGEIVDSQFKSYYVAIQQNGNDGVSASVSFSSNGSPYYPTVPLSGNFDLVGQNWGLTPSNTYMTISGTTTNFMLYGTWSPPNSPVHFDGKVNVVVPCTTTDSVTKYCCKVATDAVRVYFASPTLLKISRVPTSGGIATIDGYNLGLYWNGVFSLNIVGIQNTGLMTSIEHHKPLTYEYYKTSFPIPAGTGANHSTTVTTDGGTSNTIMFSYEAPTIVSHVFGDGVITLFGTSFGNAPGKISVKTGTSTISQVFILNPHTAIVLSTAGAIDGSRLSMTVTVDGLVSNNYVARLPVLVSLVQPLPSTQGGIVTFSGSNFGSDLSIIINGVAIIPVSISPSQIIVQFPAQSGQAQCLFQSPGMAPLTINVQYSAPNIYSAELGDSTITLKGQSFGSDVSKITIQGIVSSSISILVPHSQVVFTFQPSEVNAPNIITITVDGSVSNQLNIPSPVVTLVTPASLPTNGGKITLEGTSMFHANALAMVFNGITLIPVINPKTGGLIFDIPAGTGQVQYYIQSFSRSSIGTFTYNEPSITLATIEDSQVTVSGESFGNNLNKISINGIPSVSNLVIIEPHNVLVFDIPSTTNGAITFSVTVDGLFSNLYTLDDFYPSIVSINHQIQYSSSGIVSIIGGGFVENSTTVTIGGSTCEIISESSTLILCVFQSTTTAPASGPDTILPITITAGGFETTSNIFKHYVPPTPTTTTGGSISLHPTFSNQISSKWVSGGKNYTTVAGRIKNNGPMTLLDPVFTSEPNIIPTDMYGLVPTNVNGVIQWHLSSWAQTMNPSYFIDFGYTIQSFTPMVFTRIQ
eukprot:gene407-481_t